MKYKVLEFLVCIGCGDGLWCQSFADQAFDHKEVIEGILKCRCGCIYPIIHGVPRMLSEPFTSELMKFYPGFLKKYDTNINLPKKSRINNRIKRKTMNSFGYEWKKFANYDADNFWELVYPLKPDFFKEKVGLDIGCGTGRHSYQAAKFDSEMFGVDLSFAVDVAFEKTKRFPNIHIIQADIFNLPFRKETFDFIYSLGVLHHLPEPQKGFESLIPFLKSGGEIFIWVYSNTRKTSRIIIELIRKFTTKLPYSLLNILAFFFSIVDYGGFIKPYQILSKRKKISKVLTRLVPSRIKGYARYNFYVSYVDWFDRLSAPISHYYSEEELRNWFETANLTEIKILPTEDWGWRGFGKLNLWKL